MSQLDCQLANSDTNSLSVCLSVRLSVCVSVSCRLTMISSVHQPDTLLLLVQRLQLGSQLSPLSSRLRFDLPNDISVSTTVRPTIRGR